MAILRHGIIIFSLHDVGRFVYFGAPQGEMLDFDFVYSVPTSGWGENA